MEAVPRMPMLFFDLKTVSEKSEPTDFKVLKEYIHHAYHEAPESYSLEIHSLESLRAMAAHPQHNVDGVSTLKKYFCQLTFLKSRFPITREGPIRITFSWKEAFSSNIVSSHDVRFEQLCIMFNIGSLHSKLGVMDERVTSEGLKLACSHFQCAAWAFQQLKEINCPDVQMSSSVISFMVNTCLAQAQECVLEQSLTGNRKTIINAKVAAQIVEFYTIGLNALSAVSPEQLKYETNCSEVFDVKMHEGWKKYLRCKIHYYKAITLLYQGMQAEEEQKMGERVTYYDAAFEKLAESMTASKAIAKSDIIKNLHDLAMMAEAFSFTNDVIEGKRKAARNDNEFVYHEKVPPLDSLGELKGRDLVRGIPFSPNDPDIAGPDIFQKLIPMKAHEDASLYSEEKAKLLRQMCAKVEAADADVANFMNSLQLEIIGACHNPERLPQDLVDKCAEMSARPDAIKELTNAMAQLSDSSHDVDASLEDIKAMVTEEELNEKEYQEIMGPRPPSIVATDLKREMNKYLEAHRKAQESNQTLHQAMTFHVANLKLLCLTPTQLEKHVPPLTEIKTPQTEKTVGNLEHLVSKVDEMRHQRANLLSQLREGLLNDEITSQLVTRQTESRETVFEAALAKHNILVNLIDTNLQAQPRILSALTSAYSECAPTRASLAQVVQRRNSVLAALRASYDACEDLRDKTRRGVEFYEKLSNSVAKLQTRVKSTCKVQEEERLGLLMKENKTLPRHAKKAAEVAPKGPPSEDVPTPTPQSSGPKLKDFLAAGGGYSKRSAYPPTGYSESAYPSVPTGVRPTPVGSEMNIEVKTDSNMGPSYPAYDSVKAPMSYPGPPTASYAGSNAYPTPNPSAHVGYGHPPVSQDSGYSSQNTASYGTQYPAGNYQGGTNTPNYGTPGYPISNSSSSPSTNAYTTPNYAGGNPQSYGTHQQTSESHPSPTAQKPAYPSSSTDSPSQYASGYPQSTPTPDHTAPYPATSIPYSYPSYAGAPYSQSNSQQYTTDTTGSASATPYAPQSQGATDAYNTPTSYVSGATSYGSQYITSTNNAYYQYPVSTTPVTTPTYVNTQSQPTSYAGSQAPYGSSTHPGSNTQNSYGVSPHPNSNTQSPYGASAHPTSNTQTLYGGAATNPSSNTQTPYGAATATNTGTYPSDTASPAPQYYSQYPASDPNTAGYNAYGAYSNQSPSPYTNQYPGYGQPNYGTGQATPYDQTSSQYPGSTLSSQSSLQSYASPAGSVSSQQPNNTGSQPASYGSSYNQPSYGDQTGSQYPPTSSGVIPQSQYGSTATTLSQYSSPATTLSQYTPAISIPSQTPPPSAYPTSYSPYTPEPHLPGGTASYSYNYSSAGHTSYQPTQSSSYTPHEVTSLAQQHYYNVPYGTQSYILANGNSFVNTTPSSLTSPEVLSPTGSQYPSSQNNTAAPHQYNTSGPQYNTAAPQYPSSAPASNVDLLADLDVNITQSPLIPSSELADSLSSLSLAPSSQAFSAEVKTVPSSVDTSAASEQLPPVENKVSEELASVLSTASFTAPKPIAPSTEIILDKECLTQLAQDVEKLETLTAKTLSGPSPLDMKWKELTDQQVKDSAQQSISVARCYPMKNRSPDILPYDRSRVELPSTKDDYINASYIRSPAPSSSDSASSSFSSTHLCPPLIVTQAPLNSTVGDFWTMVWEQNVELVVCLLTDAELDSPVYWPQEKGQDLSLPKLKISLQSRTLRGAWTERILSLQDQDRKGTHVVVHLQLTMWPGSSFPSSPSQFLSLVNETLVLYRQQRSLSHPIVIHCNAGIGRSGLFVLTLLAVADINTGKGIPDLAQLAANISASRKNLLRDREHFKYAFQSVLYYTQDLLIKRGVLSRSAFEEKRAKTHSRLPSQDYLHSAVGGSKDFSNVQYTVDYTGLEESKKGHSRKSSTSSICSSSNKAELFSSQVGTLDKLSHQSTPQDPLSMIDPLWPIKKEKDPGQ